VKNVILIAVMFSVAALLFALASPSPVRASPARIENPGFETPDTPPNIANWAYSETDKDYDGRQVTAWASQGTYSYEIWSIANIGAGASAQITQTVDFTSIDTISFDHWENHEASNIFEARMLVGAVQVWSHPCAVGTSEHLHQEVDVSEYSGSLDLIIRVLNISGGPASTDHYCRFDNIKIWGSYSNSGRTTVSNDFSTYGAYVYMYGENFDTTGTYKVGYYDGGTAHSGDSGAQIEVDIYTNDADGILDESQCRPADWNIGPPAASYGTWHAVVYKTTGDMPDSYDLVSKSDSAYVVTDSFTVEATAIPEFPTVFSAIGVGGSCFGIYWWMRKRAKLRMGNAKTP